ncbi:MAG: DNA gyrase inhibitor YacG [Betaproteobacteria bacterium]|nr:DNA gyrase inhibitor YacG [bacterium]MCX7266843.1 DNA gyrase inhibitor YacG [Burkholderiales bacterium]NBX15101.1 DNA gyrase inhibitor YacG [Betaproteobacteria bacterium]NBX88648.1 DNA gyrase inhibitor YacG [Betaproteobacteria bacterium]
MSEPKSKVTQVPCPSCGQPSLFSADNPYRPFCSARCKGIDLGAWANESFRLAQEPPSDQDA